MWRLPLLIEVNLGGSGVAVGSEVWVGVFVGVGIGVGMDALVAVAVGMAAMVASTPAAMVAWVSGVLVASWSWHARASTSAKSVKTAIVGLVMDKLLKDISGRLFG